MTVDQQMLQLIHKRDYDLLIGRCSQAEKAHQDMRKLLAQHGSELSPAMAARAQSCVGCMCGATRPACWYGGIFGAAKRFYGC